jgi:ATP-dependent RNA helicase DeaD
VKEFREMNLCEALQRNIANMGWEEPSPVQAHAINPVVAGWNVLAHAEGGSGKTAAFGLPAIQLITPNEEKPMVQVGAHRRHCAVSGRRVPPLRCSCRITRVVLTLA